MDPGFAAAHFFLGQCQLWQAAREAARPEAPAPGTGGRSTVAVETLEKAAALAAESAETLAGLAYARALSGRQGEAESILAELGRRAAEGYVSPARVGQVHLALGERALALGALERAAEERSPDVVWLGVHPMFDELREDERFAALLARVELPDTESVRRTRISSPPAPTSASRPS
jgi:tetratricopeptide (TPR) repeat protein